MKVLVVTLAALLHHSMAGPADVSISHASNSFASQLYRELAKTPGNVLVCPVSVHIALALVHQGAGGNTANELANVLHLSGSNDNIKNGYKALLSGLQDNVLKIATKLYPAVSFKPNPQYVTVAQQYFFSDIQALDYGKPVDAANTINKFVENKTNNKIHDIIKPDSLSDLTRLVIVNAVHFKAGWAKTFPPSFTDNFKVTPTQTVKTDFLGQTDYFPFKEDPALGAKVLKMDYENGEYSMVFVLPDKEDGLPELEAKLATTSMDSLLNGLKDVRVEVTIPKFKIEQEMQLKDVLSKMGIVSMFDSRADLSNMATGENLYVDSVIQKTFIDVNEKGTEAAAATGVVTPLSGGSEEYTFSAQRPFHFYIIHNKAPLVILFNGRLVQPLEKAKVPPKESSQSPIDKQKISGDLNRISGNEQDVTNHNRGSGFTAGSNVGQNYVPAQPKPQNIGQNNQQSVGYGQVYGQNGPINKFNENRYPAPQSFPANNQADNVYSHRPNFQSVQPNNVQYIVQPGFSQQQQPYQRRPQPYGLHPTHQFQYHNTPPPQSSFSQESYYDY